MSADRSTLATGKDILFDDRVDTPIGVHDLGDPEIDATDISEIASSSLRPFVIIRKRRILRNASRIATVDARIW